GLSGATAGWSYRMIGEESTTSEAISTGKVPSFAQSATASAAAGRGGEDRALPPNPALDDSGCSYAVISRIATPSWGGPVACVLHDHRHLHQPAGPFGPRGGHPHPAVHRCSEPHDPA